MEIYKFIKNKNLLYRFPFWLTGYLKCFNHIHLSIFLFFVFFFINSELWWLFFLFCVLINLSRRNLAHFYFNCYTLFQVDLLNLTNRKIHIHKILWKKQNAEKKIALTKTETQRWPWTVWLSFPRENIEKMWRFLSS